MLGALIVFNAAVSAHSHEWLIATGYLRRRMIDYGLWAAGALTIGLGVFPVVAAFAAMFRAPGGPPRTPAERAFAAIFAGGIISFGWYTAIKAAFITLSLGRLDVCLHRARHGCALGRAIGLDPAVVVCLHLDRRFHRILHLPILTRCRLRCTPCLPTSLRTTSAPVLPIPLKMPRFFPGYSIKWKRS